MSSLPPPLPGARSPGQRPPRNWLQRNLRWALPLVALLIVGGWSLTYWMGLRQMAAPLESSEPYREALARAGRDPEVGAALGRPLRAKPFPFGSISQVGDGGSADMTIRVEGPHGSGKLGVRAQRSDGRWFYTRLQAELPGRHAPVDLRDARDRDCTILPRCC
jgi:hypothetical protein